jgi:hypothetical protein
MTDEVMTWVIMDCWNNKFVGCLFRCPNLLSNLLTNLLVCGFALLESEKLEVE